MPEPKKQYSPFSTVVKRHLRTSVRYLTITKICNILLSLWEKQTGAVKVRSKPYFIKIEPTSRCNLSCPGCLHAVGLRDQLDPRLIGDMDFDIFSGIIKDLKKYLVKVSMYIVGEPLIYPRIGEMIKHLSDNRIASAISSNLYFVSPELAAELVRNKLTHLIVSLDGYDQKSYARYRIGGRFATVINNIKLIQAEKKKQRSKYPLLEIQTIKLDYLRAAEIEKIKALARELGADKFTLKENVAPYYYHPEPVASRCYWLYGNPQIHWDGILQPCCNFYEDKDNNFGDLHSEKISKIYNNKKYLAARKFFKSGVKGKEPLRCYHCNFFKPKI